MRISGKYESYESETFTIQLSMRDLVDLDILFSCQLQIEESEIEPRMQAKKFIEMVNQATIGTEFGFDYFHIEK